MAIPSSSNASACFAFIGRCSTSTRAPKHRACSLDLILHAASLRHSPVRRFSILLSCRLQASLRKLLLALRPYVKEGSGKWSQSFCYGSTCQGYEGLLGRRDRDWTILAGVDALCHKKKATFWRKLAASFPQLIDFLCNPDDLGQVLNPRLAENGRALFDPAGFALSGCTSYWTRRILSHLRSLRIGHQQPGRTGRDNRLCVAFLHSLRMPRGGNAFRFFR